MNRVMPTRPSLPTAAISLEDPSHIMYMSDMVAVVGKYAWVSRESDSHNISPDDKSISSRFGRRRLHSSRGRADSNLLRSGSPVGAALIDIWGVLRCLASTYSDAWTMKFLYA